MLSRWQLDEIAKTVKSGIEMRYPLCRGIRISVHDSNRIVLDLGSVPESMRSRCMEIAIQQINSLLYKHKKLCIRHSISNSTYILEILDIKEILSSSSDPVTKSFCFSILLRNLFEGRPVDPFMLSILKNLLKGRVLAKTDRKILIEFDNAAVPRDVIEELVRKGIVGKVVMVDSRYVVEVDKSRIDWFLEELV